MRRTAVLQDSSSRSQEPLRPSVQASNYVAPRCLRRMLRRGWRSQPHEGASVVAVRQRRQLLSTMRPARPVAHFLLSISIPPVNCGIRSLHHLLPLPCPCRCTYLTRSTTASRQPTASNYPTVTLVRSNQPRSTRHPGTSASWPDCASHHPPDGIPLYTLSAIDNDLVTASRYHRAL